MPLLRHKSALVHPVGSRKEKSGKVRHLQGYWAKGHTIPTWGVLLEPPQAPVQEEPFPNDKRSHAST